MTRRIAHLDMDAFYASVELQRYPQLKGLPVVIGGGRSHIKAALERLMAQSPEHDWTKAAQREALRHIPIDDFARLASYTGRGVITTASYAARQFGVGSAMGMMKAAKLCPQGGRVLARLIQKSIFEAIGLTCSVGVAPNKLLAKMASEFNKPNGISIVFEDDLQSLIWPLACRKVNGIGPKADEKLKGLGIHTMGDLAAKDEQWLIDHFGQARRLR